jgi:hypothetical protein
MFQVQWQCCWRVLRRHADLKSHIRNSATTERGPSTRVYWRFMKRLVSVSALFACLTFGQPEQANFVSTAFGSKVKLYEQENSGLLTFTLVNGMPAAIEQYLIETWSSEEHGAPIRRSCVIEMDHATIPPDSMVTVQDTCTLVSDPSTGRLSHSSRIIAIRLANGWKWHVPVQYRLARSPQ